jgi:hypothetical protein
MWDKNRTCHFVFDEEKCNLNFKEMLNCIKVSLF